MKRILTKKDWDRHYNQYKRRYLKICGIAHPSVTDTGEHCTLTTNLAAYHSNIYHNPETGFHEFLPDAPLWVIEMAIRQGWEEWGCLQRNYERKIKREVEQGVMAQFS